MSVKSPVRLTSTATSQLPEAYGSDDAIVIVRDRLMVKGDKEHIYQVFGYLDNSVLAATNWKKNGFLQIFYDGRLGSRYEKIPDGLKLGPNYQALHLRRAQ